MEIECANGLDWGVSVFFEGCPYQCPGCFNQELWKSSNKDSYYKNYHANCTPFLEFCETSYIHRASFLGGEPLTPDNSWTLSLLLESLLRQEKYWNKKIAKWVWTGTTFEALYNLINAQHDENSDKILEAYNWTLFDIERLKLVLNNIDYLVDGRFIQEQKDLTLKFRGSKNQRILDMPASMSAGKAILANI